MAKKPKHSDAAVLRKHILEALRFLAQSRPVGTYAKDLQKSCNIAISTLQGCKEDTWSLVMAPWTFELGSPCHRGQEDCIKIVMGAEIRASAGRLVRQTVPICVVVKPGCVSHDPPWCQNPSGQDLESATRRLHFDFDAEVTKWPKSHLQIGGNPHELRTAGSYHYAVAKDPSEPRVPAPSLDLVLALDLVMRDFNTGVDLPQEPGWRKLVFRSEELALKPYFSSAYTELKRADRKVTLIEYLSQ